MKKDAFYFPHFCNARHDRKIKRVLKELGIEGYGIYFMLLEVLREQIDFKYPLGDIDLLADEFGTSEQKVRTVIANYQLFQVDEKENFFSIKQIYYLQPYIEKTERARKAAKLRWDNAENQQDNANAMQMHSKSTANAMQVKESKVKESKGEESKVNDFLVPSLCQIWYTVFPTYTKDQKKDFPAAAEIFKFICEQHGILDFNAESDKIKATFQQIAEQVSKDNFWKNKPLKSIASNIQEFYNKIKNPINGNSTNQRRPSRAEQHQQGYKELYRDAARRNGYSEGI